MRRERVHAVQVGGGRGEEGGGRGGEGRREVEEEARAEKRKSTCSTSREGGGVRREEGGGGRGGEGRREVEEEARVRRERVHAVCIHVVFGCRCLHLPCLYN